MKKSQPIQRQIYFILTAILAGFMLISIVSAYLFFWPALIRQDQEHAVTNSLRVYKLFRNESSDLQQTVSDWAVWDDSYKFIEDGNKQYIQSNLAANTFSNLNVNDIMYIHNDGRLIWAGSLASDMSSVVPINQEIVLAARKLYSSDLYEKIGIISTNNELFFIEISEVIDSAEKHPPIGMLAMTRRIDKSFFEQKRDQLQINLNLKTQDSADNQGVWSDNQEAVIDTFTVEKEKDDFIVTFTIPLNNQGSMAIVVRTPRHVALEAQRILIVNGFAVLLSSLLLLWSISLVLKKRVILPLHDISTKVISFNKKPVGMLQLDHTGSLELERISEAIVAMHARIMKIATHDQLTGLANRRLLDERINNAKQRATRQGNNFIVLYIDLDGFKQVNDTHGHEVGDLVLQEIANRLLPVTRLTDTVSRIGGDEFIILLDPGCKEKSDIEAICTRLIKEIEAPVIIKDAGCALSASIGIAIYPDCSEDTTELLKMADQALYRAKSSGKATYCFA